MEDFVEGARCPRLGCPGTLADLRDSGCSCHISPPCGHCVNTYLHCDECDWEGDGSDFEGEWEGVDVPAKAKPAVLPQILVASPPCAPPAPVVMRPSTCIGEWKEERRVVRRSGYECHEKRCGAMSVSGRWIWSDWWLGGDGDAEADLSCQLWGAYLDHQKALQKERVALDVAAYPTNGVMVTGATCQ